MRHTKCCKLIEVLRTLTPGEFNNLEKIAASPYFSTGRNYTPYIRALKKYYPAFEGENFYKNNSRKYIFNIVHPGKKYNDQYIKNIFTDIIHLAEETFFLKISKEHNHQNLSFLAIEETKRNLFHLAHHNVEILDKLLEEKGVDEMYFYYKGMNEIADSVLYNKIHGSNHETGKPFSTGIYFIYFSLITLALSVHNSSVRNSMLNLKEDMQFSEYFAGLIDLEKFAEKVSMLDDSNKELILIFIYYLIHKTKNPVYSNYEKMRNLLLKNHRKFSPRMLFYITSLLLNILYEDKNNIKEEIFRQEYHDIALFTLKNNCYKIMKSGSFQFNKFRSYYLNALALGELDWVRNFVDKYLTELLPDLRDETLHLINANIKFENKLYKESLEELKNIKFTNLFSKSDSRVLKLKIYFHKGMYLKGEESLEAFRKFISKNSLTRNIFRGDFTIFLSYYKKLLNIAEGRQNEPESIFNELKKTPAFAERSWIIENFENLINQKTFLKSIT